MKNLISEDLTTRLFNILLLLIGCTFFIAKVSTVLIIVFVVYCLLFKRDVTFSKTSIYIGGTIASLLLVEIIFAWHGTDFSLTLKSIEKYLSLLIFPIFILGNYKDVNVKFILVNYCRVTFLLTLFFFIRFFFLFTNNVELYLQGEHLWEAGYVLVNSFGNHAPNVNLHLAFVVSILFYYFILDYSKNSFLKRTLEFFCIMFLIVFVFIINTRVALVLMFLDCFLVLIYFVKMKRIFISKIGKLTLLFSIVILVFSTIFTIVKVPYYQEKFSVVTFGYLDKVGKLDEIDKPEAKVYNSLALRLSVWKSVLDIYKENNVFIGVGSSDFDTLLFEHYEKTNQHFLRKYELGPHNQYIESLAKFGLVGIITILGYIFLPWVLGIKVKSILMIIFSLNLFLANFFDGYLFLFMGIVYSGWFISIFGAKYLQKTEKKLKAIDN